MRFVAFKLGVPVVLGLSLGDVSPAGATPPVPWFGMHGTHCRAKDPADQSKLVYDEYGVSNKSTTSVAVICPLGTFDPGSRVNVQAVLWRDNQKPLKCFHRAVDEFGNVLYAQSKSLDSGNPIVLGWDYTPATDIHYAWLDCTLPLATSSGRAYVTSVAVY